MYVKTVDERPRTLKTPGLSEPVEFGEDGHARVSKDVGETLVAEAPGVVESYEKPEGSSDEDEADSSENEADDAEAENDGDSEADK